eukprot:SM000001S04498  [mRNA]  locus=s1:490734:494099:- [translate_table: standard]
MTRLAVPFLIIVGISSFIATYNTMNVVFSHSGKHASHDGASMETGVPGGTVDVVTDDASGASVIAAKRVLGGRRGGGASGSDSRQQQDTVPEDHPVVIRPATTLAPKQKRMFHTLVTANESPYNKWQCRIMYHWYKHFAKMPESEMGGFTRILHSGQADNMMEEIPTFVVDPLPPGMDKGYVVLNRPWAFVQWVKKATIEEEYVLMAEPDHIFVRPLPNLATEFMPAAFPFFYITPKENEKIVRKFYPEELGPVTNIDPIGNSPVIIKKKDLETIAPTWHNMSLAMKSDPEADEVFGWVLEMYAYAVSSALHGVHHILRKDFMVQPPWDTLLAENYIIHYTYGCDYTQDGVFTPGKVGWWHFDKREWSGGAPPKNITLPPAGAPETVVTLITRLNDAMNVLPRWTEGQV